MIRIFLPVVALLVLASCGGSDAQQDGVGGVSAGEAQALNEAAAVIDARTGAAQSADPRLNPAAVAAARADRGRAAARPDVP